MKSRGITLLAKSVCALSILVVTVHTGCGDRDAPAGPDAGNQTGLAALQDVTVSEPSSAAGPTGALAAGAEGFVYVSASPGALPLGLSATVTNSRTGESVSIKIVDGGFDPVSLVGLPGDVLEFVVENSDGSRISFSERVPARRRPRVVRTRPPRGATTVVLNATALVIFTEPVDDRSVTIETVKLLLDGAPVDGAVLLSDDGLRAEFTPDADLATQTTYTLIITTDVQDLLGDALEEEVTLTFTTQPPVASVTVTPVDVVLAVGQKVQFLATLRDADDDILVGRRASWSSSDEDVAVVDSTGRVTGIAVGQATITATSDGQSGSASVTVGAAGGFVQVSAGTLHTCGITPLGTAYCWGHPTQGQLGIGTSLPATDQFGPAPVQGGLRFATLAVGNAHTCGVTTAGRPYCWGYNFFGQLGDGDYSGADKYKPVPVAGNLTLINVSAGGDHNCGVATTGETYCWGSDWAGQLGDGPTEYFGHESVKVSGGLSFVTITAGEDHTCGITIGGEAYCWGVNGYGQLGDSTADTQTNWRQTAPVPVAGGVNFKRVSAGGRHTCGIGTDGVTYCWGSNEFGRLGVGSGTTQSCTPSEIPCSSIPLRVSGEIEFVSVSAGGSHTCGIGTDGVAYCWGANAFGQFGDGSTIASSMPTPAASGLTFVSIDAGWDYTCGVSVENGAYCWGRNHHGQLGDGTLEDRHAPVRVRDQN